MRGLISPIRILLGIVAAVIITVVILIKIDSGYYLLLPDIAHPVTPLVQVTGAKPANDGKLFFVDVQEKQATELDHLLRNVLYPHSTEIPAKVLIPPGTNTQQYFHLGILEMKTSKQIASVVAERQLGYKVVFKPLGLRVYKVDKRYKAKGILQPGDLITSVNGTTTLTESALHSEISAMLPGDVATIGILRKKTPMTVKVTLSRQKGETIMGVIVFAATKLELPVKVKIDSGNIGGPSAGLAFTLEIMRQLGDDVTHGYKVAATGQMNLNGSVSAIGGVKQKTYGVREAGAQVFLVPADGGNAKTAQKFAGPDLRIIPVTSIGQALKALAALPAPPKK